MRHHDYFLHHWLGCSAIFQSFRHQWPPSCAWTQARNWDLTIVQTFGVLFLALSSIAVPTFSPYRIWVVYRWTMNRVHRFPNGGYCFLLWTPFRFPFTHSLSVSIKWKKVRLQYHFNLPSAQQLKYVHLSHFLYWSFSGWIIELSWYTVPSCCQMIDLFTWTFVSCCCSYLKQPYAGWSQPSRRLSIWYLHTWCRGRSRAHQPSFSSYSLCPKVYWWLF